MASHIELDDILLGETLASGLAIATATLRTLGTNLRRAAFGIALGAAAVRAQVNWRPADDLDGNLMVFNCLAEITYLIGQEEIHELLESSSYHTRA